MEKYQLVLDQVDQVMDIVTQRVKLIKDDPEVLKEIARKHISEMEEPKQWSWYIDKWDEEKEEWQHFFKELKKAEDYPLYIEDETEFYYTSEEVAKILPIKKKPLLNKLQTGEIKAERIGSQYRIHQREVHQLIRELEVKRKLFEEAMETNSDTLSTKEDISSRLSHYVQVSLMSETKADLKAILIKLSREIENMVDTI